MHVECFGLRKNNIKMLQVKYMAKSKRILIISDINYNPVKMTLNQSRKLAKGFIRLGHDAEIFSYWAALRTQSPFKSKSLTSRFYKSRTDEILVNKLKSYKPHIVCICFPRDLDGQSIRRMRTVSPDTIFIGFDGDPWPKLQKSNKIETAKALDILTATNDGQFLQDYRDAGVPLCVFMPNVCDADIDRHYEVDSKWKTDILWTGKAKHGANSGEILRKDIVNRLAQQANCSLYGCCGQPQIGGFDYLYAISGAKIGVNVNAINSVRMYHSDRLTHYLACGTFVLAKSVPDTDLLFKDDKHLKYFETAEEFFELADYYLNHEEERKNIADTGMKWVHEQFNSIKIAGYILELIEKGRYSAPWFTD